MLEGLSAGEAFGRGPFGLRYGCGCFEVLHRELIHIWIMGSPLLTNEIQRSSSPISTTSNPSHLHLEVVHSLGAPRPLGLGRPLIHEQYNLWTRALATTSPYFARIIPLLVCFHAYLDARRAWPYGPHIYLASNAPGL